MKVEVIKQIVGYYNSKKYEIGEKLEVYECKKFDDLYLTPTSKTALNQEDFIPKDSVKLIHERRNIGCVDGEHDPDPREIALFPITK